MRFYTEEDIKAFDNVRFLHIKTAKAGHLFIITLARPEKRNAFTPTMAEEIIYALAYAHYRTEIRCVVLKAEGPVFCAGADLNAFHDPSANAVNDLLPRIQEEARMGDAFNELLKPCIAQVEGPVLAGGFLMICGCTFVYSVPEATFSLPEVKRGIWPMQVMASLAPILPQRKILEMSITGKAYSAKDALEMGLITHLTEKEKIAEEVNALATQICNSAPLAIQSGMRSLRELMNVPQNEQHTFLKGQLDNLLQTEDAKEGALAFKEKREPIWKGK
ncbi:enoyl-CoA hydratase/carnithine racemase [Dyadobacter sp. BE34]|uniref:Enoyl-CoA hydratase/carnithine racemase n=1 Tax=Dyadobacter fermentans TaxID=94254 RepID=A0ABU1QRK1_9BACT|nr:MULTISPECIES: enoyl-CoA hydratase-related protein [Dyadobacter]MDR6803390.1 enoyl-CoA hydratase/carnithine racemase [Dyadobacter fermentans]MDR7041131.1 enoyl-CoA hydratase/carnithine racemase [Dyadobacter sp. BE242]MDR7195534.1 enoyl-CoA hydratase/carnithine racemase [Dyadobacter sp. BE34]MDR7213921.1 enoyl-CoA hydratase/carnithine racemase [Dyadobacter sp. BE31]MDR7260941.1 enoyl-CoA hydratase/carnithine racemase [Dyadobacter sp. BE32]